MGYSKDRQQEQRVTIKKPVFKPINLIQNSYIGQLQRQIALQQQLLLQVKAALPEFLAGGQVVHCVLKNSQLLLFTGSAAWASQLRFYSQTLLRTLMSNNVQVTSVQIRVCTQSAKTEPQLKKASKLSPEKIEFLQSYSNSIQDAQLKASFLEAKPHVRAVLQR